MKMVEIKLQAKSKEAVELISTISVEQLTENSFRMTCNEVLFEDLPLGTEFETISIKKDLHEILRITKKSTYITKRYMLSSKYNQSDYQVIGDQITKHGGHWQVDFGSIATVNIPPNYLEEYDRLIQSLNLDSLETA
jgi:hypothetical protein